MEAFKAMATRDRDWQIIFFKTDQNQSAADQFLMTECKAQVPREIFEAHFKQPVMLYFQPGFMTKIFTGNFAYFKNLHAYASSHYEQDAKILHAIIKLLPKNLYQLYLAERTNDQK